MCQALYWALGSLKSNKYFAGDYSYFVERYKLPTDVSMKQLIIHNLSNAIGIIESVKLRHENMSSKMLLLYPSALRCFKMIF